MNYYNKYVKYKEKYLDLKGGWRDNACRINKPTVKNRLNEDIKNYTKYGYGYVNLNGTVTRNISNVEILLRFKINIIKCNDDDVIGAIGTFIRTTVRLLVNIDPRQILFVLDFSLCCNELKYISKIIDKIISDSTTAVVFTNVIIILPECFYKNTTFTAFSDKLKDSCLEIQETKNTNAILNNTQPFNIISYNGLIKCNMFNNFCSKKQYVNIDADIRMVGIYYAPLIHQLASYTMEYLISDKTRTFIVCIEKESNVHRVYKLFEIYNLIDVLIVCLPEHKESADQINSICQTYSIETLSIENAESYISKQKEIKNIVSIDLHPNAISYVYNRHINELNNCIVIFGFESTGIPQSLLALSNTFIQLEARSSINVIATASIILSSLYA